MLVLIWHGWAGVLSIMSHRPWTKSFLIINSYLLCHGILKKKPHHIFYLIFLKLGVLPRNGVDFHFACPALVTYSFAFVIYWSCPLALLETKCALSIPQTTICCIDTSVSVSATRNEHSLWIGNAEKMKCRWPIGTEERLAGISRFCLRVIEAMWQVSLGYLAVVLDILLDSL